MKIGVQVTKKIFKFVSFEAKLVWKRNISISLNSSRD